MAASPGCTTLRTSLEAAQPLACRCVILNGYLLLVGWFGNLARELSDELGPIDPKGGDSFYFRLIKQYFGKLRAIHDGKLMMHDALQGKPEDTRLLRKLKAHIDALQEKVINPLARLPKKRALVIKRIRQVGNATKAICTAASEDLRDADRRFAEALSVSTPPQVGHYAVLSVDMVKYSKHALARETQEGIRGLFAFNESVQERLEYAIRQAGAEPAEVPIYNAGDGALVFCKPGRDMAVRLAQLFQKDAVGRNKQTAGVRGEPRRFRIGIATGEVCMQFQFNPAGSLWGFTAAGTAIITAVRIQAACKENEVMIDGNTYAALSKKYKECFVSRKPVRSDAHPNGSIEVRAWC